MFSEVKTLFKHSSIYSAAGIIRKSVGFIMIPVYTRYLKPSDYGLLELLELTLTVAVMFVGMRFGGALIRYYHQYESPEDQQEVFTSALIFNVFVCFVALLLMELFSSDLTRLITGGTDYLLYFQLIFVCLALRGLSLVPESYLLAQKKSFTYSIISIGVLICSLSLNIFFLVYMGMGVFGIVLSMLITKALNGITVLSITLRNVPLKFSWKKTKEMLLFGLPLVPGGAAVFVMHFSDRFFIQKFCSPDELGIYSLGYKFGMILSIMISQPFFSTWNTQRFEIAKTPDSPRIFGRVFTYYSLIMIFMALGISVLINEAIAIIAPHEYQGASLVVPIIVISYIIFGISNFFTLGIMIRFKTKYLSYLQITVAILNVLFNLYFVSRFGIIGAALSTFLTFFCLAFFMVIVSQRLFFIHLEYKRLAILFLLSGIVFSISKIVNSTLLISIGLKSLLLMSFPAILFLIGFFDKKEITKAKELLSSLTEKTLFFRQFHAK